MKAITFERTVGWLHLATGARGVVIAGAHGFEDLCSRRFLTLAARGIAEAGLPVLQFDYPGCGDALGDHDAPGLVGAWRSGIGAAIDTLKAETGVVDVLVVAFRLGALLAPGAVAGRQDVAGLALLAAPSSGKAYARELAGLSRMIDAALPPLPAPGPLPFDGIEAAGFRIGTETLVDLRKLDWRADLGAFGGDVLLMPQQALTAKDEPLEADSRVRSEVFSGYARLMSTPTANEIPAPVVETVVRWAAERSLEGDRPAVRGAAPAVLVKEAELRGDGFAEFPVALDPAPQICGVLCVPTNSPPKGPVALIVNSGAIPHIGWARGAVEMARALAQQGVASMRVDLPGLGQSGDPSEKRLFLYDERGSSDVKRIVDWLEARGWGNVGAVGLCAGAFQAFHAARSDERITHLTLVNPLCFAWNGTYALDMELSKVRDNARAAAKLKEDAAGAENEATPGARGSLKASLLGIAKRILRGGMELAKSAALRLPKLSGGDGQPVERWMRSLAARGTQVLVLSAEGDRSLEEIARHFGREGERLRRIEGVDFGFLQAADHTLTAVHARAQLAAHVLRQLRPGPTERAGSRQASEGFREAS